jgi:hypothetical protein
MVKTIFSSRITSICSLCAGGRGSWTGSSIGLVAGSGKGSLEGSSGRIAGPYKQIDPLKVELIPWSCGMSMSYALDSTLYNTLKGLALWLAIFKWI